MTLTRKERQAQTRSKLLLAATRVFSRCGLHEGSIDDVAHEAGYTKGAFYANFRSKDELFLAMLEERFAERAAEIEALSVPGEGMLEQARVAGDDFVRHLAAEPEWNRMFFEFALRAVRDEKFRPELLSRYGLLRSRLSAVFARRGSELGEDPPITPEQAAAMTFAMANGFALERLLEPDAVDDADFGLMLAIFFAGVRALTESPAGSAGQIA